MGMAEGIWCGTQTQVHREGSGGVGGVRTEQVLCIGKIQ